MLKLVKMPHFGAEITRIEGKIKEKGPTFGNFNNES